MEEVPTDVIKQGFWILVYHFDDGSDREGLTSQVKQSYHRLIRATFEILAANKHTPRAYRDVFSRLQSNVDWANAFNTPFRGRAQMRRAMAALLQEKPWEKGMKLLGVPKKWGRIVWRFAHALALVCPPELTPVFIQFVKSFADALPCKKCANSFRTLVARYFEGKDRSREAPQTIMLNLHRQVNKKLGKDDALKVPENLKNKNDYKNSLAVLQTLGIMQRPKNPHPRNVLDHAPMLEEKHAPGKEEDVWQQLPARLLADTPPPPPELLLQYPELQQQQYDERKHADIGPAQPVPISQRALPAPVPRVVLAPKPAPRHAPVSLSQLLLRAQQQRAESLPKTAASAAPVLGKKKPAPSAAAVAKKAAAADKKKKKAAAAKKKAKSEGKKKAHSRDRKPHKKHVGCASCGN